MPPHYQSFRIVLVLILIVASISAVWWVIQPELLAAILASWECSRDSRHRTGHGVGPDAGCGGFVRGVVGVINKQAHDYLERSFLLAEGAVDRQRRHGITDDHVGSCAYPSIGATALSDCPEMRRLMPSESTIRRFCRPSMPTRQAA